jgi:LacI family transcriptional regulator
MNQQKRSHEMLSNGTIDGFVSVSEEAQNQDYDHFSAIINDGTQ